MKETNKQERGIRIFLLPVILISLLTALDQFTKYVVQSSFELHQSKPVIDGVFAFTYIQNRGMAWGMFQGKIPIFLIFTAIIVILSFRIMYNVVDNKRYKWAKYVLILLISGALGNLIDRVSLGYVVDFFNFELIDFPVFNVADIYVVVSMISAMILLLFVYSNEEIDDILRIKFNNKIDNDEESKEKSDEALEKAVDTENIED